MSPVRNAECGVRSVKPWIGLLVLLGMMGTARGQGGVPAEGTEILRGLLKYHGFKPVEFVGRDARSTLVVVVGDERIPAPIARSVPDIVLRGGGLLVISDGPFNLRPLLPQVGALNPSIRITGLKVENEAADKCFRRDAASPLPVVAAGDPTMLGLAKRGGATVIAVREPSTVTSLRNPLLNSELLIHPDDSRYSGNGQIRVNDNTPLAVMSDANLPGLAMAFASRSLFANEFMVAADANGNRTDNFLYTFLITRLIAQKMKANGGPMECVFVEDRNVNTDFDRVGFVERPEMNLPPGFPPVLPPLPVLLDFALDKGNDLVAQAEARDLPNAVLLNDRNNQVQNGFLTMLAVVASLVLARYLLARGWSTRHAPELTPRLRIDPDRGGVIPERRYALLESGNLYEPMRDHLRFVFSQWGAAGAHLPNIKTDRPGRPRQRIYSDLFKLWQIAFAPERTTVAPDDLEELEDMISELSKAHEAGVWQFASGGRA